MGPTHHKTLLLPALIIPSPSTHSMPSQVLSYRLSLKQALLDYSTLLQLHQALSESVSLLPLYEKTKKRLRILSAVLQSLYGLGLVAYYYFKCKRVRFANTPKRFKTPKKILLKQVCTHD
jgi:hypothetical protein